MASAPLVWVSDEVLGVVKEAAAQVMEGQVKAAVWAQAVEHMRPTPGSKPPYPRPWRMSAT